MKNAKKILGLLGRNVHYSYSPLIHNTASEILHLPFYYTVFNIESPNQVPAALAGAKALGIAGFNVTIPYKQTVLQCLDTLSPEASKTGAVNTIVNRNGKLEGYNTDITGVSAPLEPYTGRIAGHPAGIFGNGGAALAAIEALSLNYNPSSIRLFVRNLDKGELLVNWRKSDNNSPKLELFSMQDHCAMKECRLLINATPIGTKGFTGENDQLLPGPDTTVLHDEQVVFDMVYNPMQTVLLTMAETAGAAVIPGIEMLLAQAAESFRIWTGQAMPLQEVRTKLLEEICRRA